MKEVNLFDSYLKAPNKRALAGQSLKIGAIVLLAAYCVVGAAVFSYWLVLKQKDGALVRKIDEQRRQITGLKEVESLHVLIKERLKVLGSEELADRKEFSFVVSQIEQLWGSGINIDKVAIDTEGNLMMGGESPDAVAMAEFFGKLTEMSKNTKADWVEVTSASRTKTGSYTFEVTSYAD